MNTVVYDLPFTDYCSAPGINVHALHDFVKSPATYLWKKTHPRTETDALRFGRLLHLTLFEPRSVAAQFAVRPDETRGGSKLAREAMAEWLAELEEFGRTPVEPEDITSAQDMVGSLYANPNTATLIDDIEFVEVSLFADGRKGRADALTRSFGILDLKSTIDASRDAFMRECLKRRYHVQNSYYQDLVTMSFPDVWKIPTFDFLAIEKHPPYLCAAYSLPQHAIDKGRGLYKAELEGLRSAIEWNNFPGYVSGELGWPAWDK